MADILLVGEDRERAGGIRSLLRGDGHEVTWLRSPQQWPQAEREARPELIVAAVESPEEVMRAPWQPVRGFPAPLLFVQHDGDLSRESEVAERLVDRIQSPFMAEELLARVDALVKVRRVVRRKRGRDGEDRAAGIGGLGRRLRTFLSRRVPTYSRPRTPYLEVAARVADWADRRDMFEPGHAGRVASFCAMMADGLELPDSEVEILLRSAMLHDIGKVTLPVEVLRHHGPLDDDRMRLVRTHAERGAALLSALDPDDPVAQVVLYHHERPDGTGYFGKTADAVPRASRILAVAEAYDAMTTARWNEPLTPAAALDRLRGERGLAYDPQAVDALVDALKPRPATIPLGT